MNEALCKLLEENGVEYRSIRHHVDFTAKQAAVDTRTPPEEFAKTVFVAIDGEFAVVVIPASELLLPEKLSDALGAGEVRLAHEDEIARICPDCEVGAAHPFGNLYGLPVYVSATLAGDEWITFNAGSHDLALRVSFQDFSRIARPRILAVSDVH